MPKALIADDHALFRSAVGMVLKSLCAIDEVVEAESLDQAVERLEHEATIDVAIFDLGMPGMQTVTSLAAIRDTYPELKVVVLTASTRRLDMLAALESGLHGYIPKTLGSEGIAQALRYVIEGDIYVPRAIAERDVDRPIMMTRGLDLIGRLSLRQREVLERLIMGDSNKLIARTLGVAENTVKVHANAVYRLFGVANRRDLAHSLRRSTLPN